MVRYSRLGWLFWELFEARASNFEVSVTKTARFLGLEPPKTHRKVAKTPWTRCRNASQSSSGSPEPTVPAHSDTTPGRRWRYGCHHLFRGLSDPFLGPRPKPKVTRWGPLSSNTLREQGSRSPPPASGRVFAHSPHSPAHRITTVFHVATIK